MVTPAAGVRFDPLLRVDGLTVHLRTDRGPVRVLDEIAFALEPGKTLGVVGESGCGKTLLCRTLIGLLPAAAAIDPEARAWFQGKNLLHLSQRALNRIRAVNIAMIFQDPLSSLNPVMTVGRQISEVLIHHKRMAPHRARRRALELLAAVEVPSPEQRVDQYPHQMSGGMRQRVAIAIALACGPALLIADEPTTALDVTVQEAILDLLVQTQAEAGMALILVTHDLGIAATRTDEVVVMYAGRILEQLPAQKLFTDARMPYTRALVAAIPKMDCPPHTPLRAIEGQPPQPAEKTAGCAFAPRCDRVEKRCRALTPPMRSDKAPRHRFACWNPIPGGGR